MGETRAAANRESGQSTVEWIGLLLVCALLLVGVLAAAGARFPGAELARAIGARILCAVSLSDSCMRDPELVAAYGEDLAAMVRAHAPDLSYEQGMAALPVDFRSCRTTACADGPGSGEITTSHEGQPVASFVHVVDCRAGTASESVAAGFDCSGARAGNVYIQYWFYYANSATLRDVPVVGEEGFHPDDWEGYQVRIAPDGTVAVRASSHHGYNHTLSRVNWTSDIGADELAHGAELVGLREVGGWGGETGKLYISGGSHAGHAREDDVRRTVEDAAVGAALPPYGAYELGDLAATELFGGDPPPRMTPGSELKLIPVESIARSGGVPTFAITPPWRKWVYRDPEFSGT